MAINCFLVHCTLDFSNVYIKKNLLKGNERRGAMRRLILMLVVRMVLEHENLP